MDFISSFESLQGNVMHLDYMLLFTIVYNTTGQCR